MGTMKTMDAVKKPDTVDIAFVCSPYRAKSTDPETAAAEVRANRDRAKLACKVLTRLGYLPLAPHLYFTEFLNDDHASDREDGICLGLKWLEMASEFFCFGDEITEGMSIELARAKELGVPVRMMPEPEELIKDLLEAVREENIYE